MHICFLYNRKFLRISYYIKTLCQIAEARKGSYSYESAPRERVRERTLCSNHCHKLSDYMIGYLHILYRKILLW